ncbi:MAG: hypothetical protein GTN49_10755 [candidate division Zixibacteria bacterium]|nr:hypothetical protein [candidate division Zixibacteria bacterium]
MTTRKITTVTEEDAAEDADLIEVIDDDEDINAELDALEGMISEFSGAADTVVNVYRQGDGKNLSFLFRTNPGEMTGGEIMERCRDNYGTGDYRIHIRQGPRLRANKPFSVEAKKEPDPATQSGSMDTAAIIAMMQDNNNRTMQMFSETMRALSEGLRGREQPAFDPVAASQAMVQQLAVLQKMAKPEDTSTKAVEMLVQGLTLAKEFAPNQGETNSSDILLQALKTFGEPLAKGVEQMQAGKTTGALAGPHDPQTASDAEREREMGIRKMMLKQQLGFLVQNAAAGKNPELYAELLLDQLGEEQVLSFVNKPDALDQLIAIDGNVANYRPWFEALRGHILALTGATGETELIPGNGQTAPFHHQNVIIPGNDAISDADDDGDITGTSAGASGDTADA